VWAALEGLTNPKEAQMKLERRNEGYSVRDTREEEPQRDQRDQRDDDRYDTRHSRTLRMQAAERDDDPLRGKSDGEILMRYEF
jgi:hypothetical protein